VISRVTIFSLLLALMLGTGIRLWDAQQKDTCSLYMAGDKTQPPSELVVSGSREIEVPCSNWFLRHSLRVQVLCLLELLLAMIFAFNASADLKGWLEIRRRRRSLP
jgi:hypothetical protein